MATKSIVPRATGEGGLGTSAKKWLAAYINNLYPGTIVLGSDADGDMYYRASSVLARLAKGAADLKMFMNAGATAPEWAAGVKIGALTRDMTAASGNVGYTGVGFKPFMVIFIGGVSPATNASWGFDTVTNKFIVAANSNGTADDFSNADNASILIYTGSGVSQQATIASMDADGFTLTWIKTGSPTGTATIGYLAFR